jgi:hypothetical protein
MPRKSGEEMGVVYTWQPKRERENRKSKKKNVVDDLQDRVNNSTTSQKICC